MNKEYMKETIIFKAKDNNGNIVECTPHLFVVALAKATGTTIQAVKAKISKSSSRFKKKLEEVLNEKRLPTGGELMSFTTILGTSKDKVEKAFAVLVKAGTIKSNNDTTKAPESESEVNTLNLQFTWPKDWGENVEEIGAAICEIFRSGDFKNNSLFCNYRESDDTIIVAADSGKFESPKSFGKFIEALRTVINYIYINSPFDASVNELDEPIYKLVDDAVYSTLHEVVLNGVEEGIDLAPLQKYLYKKGVVNLPNVNDDTIKPEDRMEPASKESIMNKTDTVTITNTPVEIEMTLPKVTIKSSSGKIDEQLIRDVVKTYNGKVDLEIDI